MKGEDLYVFRSRILDSMTFVLFHAPEDFPPEHKTDLDRERHDVLSKLAELRSTLKTKEQQTWHTMAEQEAAAAFDAFAGGDRKRGAYLIQRSAEHFRLSFKRKKIRPGFVVGADGQAIKT
jgi:hypothetical protein